MKPELNQEYPASNEQALIEEMVRLTVEGMKPHQGRYLRGQHAKPTGCVIAEFKIRDDIPEALRHGVFREPNKTFAANIRFSNSQSAVLPDYVATARGMAIKLFDVDGAPALPGNADRCQDFLLIDHPVFPFASPAEYVKAFRLKSVPVIGIAATGAWIALFQGRSLRILLNIRAKPVKELLGLTYWSGSPYRLGPEPNAGGKTVKYSVRPRVQFAETASDADRNHDDFLSRSLANCLKSSDAVFDFCVQLQTDPVAMPVEDLTVEWDERVSKPIPVATLTIPAQDIESEDGRILAERCEKMAFTPWNALAEHRPMGGLNRMRKDVYLASLAKRSS
jgi:hypothetical protein